MQAIFVTMQAKKKKRTTVECLCSIWPNKSKVIVCAIHWNRFEQSHCWWRCVICLYPRWEMKPKKNSTCNLKQWCCMKSVDINVKAHFHWIRDNELFFFLGDSHQLHWSIELFKPIKVDALRHFWMTMLKTIITLYTYSYCFLWILVRNNGWGLRIFQVSVKSISTMVFICLN